MQRHFMISGLVFILTIGFTQIFSSWAAVSLDRRIMEADLVVKGKIKMIKKGMVRGKRKYDFGVLEISAVLKGKKEIKKVNLAFLLVNDLKYKTHLTDVKWVL